MNLSALFIHRPVMTTLVMVAILLVGLMGYRNLPVSDLPNVDFPTIQVSASLPGASPETMASSVATPLEKQFSTIAGIDSMTSSSTIGGTSITLQFALDRELDAAAQDVQAAIAATQRQLPRDMPAPPSFQKVNPADQPILFVAVRSPTLPLSQVDEYAQTLLAQRISMVTGVAQVQVYGSQKYAVRIQLDPDALASRGIAVDEVAAAVASENVNLPLGTVYGPRKAFTVQANGQITGAAGYRPLIVAWRDGHPVRLQEIGRVVDSVENDRQAAWFVDQRAIVMAIQRQPGTNTVEVAEAIKRLLPAIERQLPASVTLHVLYDRSQSIRQSVREVKTTLLLTLFLVVAVIFLFLRNVSATVIPSLALPMSLVGTFAVMDLLGYSVDNLSMMALTLSVGFVVDDAIVMLENVVRHMEMGKQAREAALDGSREIGFTILSMTLSLAAVFIPVLFMGGILGRLFHEFAVTIGVAILLSGFVSLTLTPMLASRFLVPGRDVRHGRLYLLSERAFAWTLATYEAGLRWSLAHRRTVLAASALVLGATFWLFAIVPKGFLPSEDTGQIRGSTEAAEGTSFASMVDHQKVVAAILQANPNVEAFMSNAGGRGSGGSSQGFCFVRLKDRSARDASVDEVIAQLRPKLAQIPGLRVYLMNPPPIQIGGRMSRSLYQFTLFGQDTEDLYQGAQRMEGLMRAMPDLTDVSSDLQIKNPQILVDIDRDKAASLGVTAQDIETTLYNAYGSRQVSTIQTPTNQYQVIVELLPEFQRDPAALGALYVRSSVGRLVPLGALAGLRTGLGPLQVNHSGQIPSVTLSFNLRPGASLGETTREVEQVAREQLPATISVAFQGTAQAFQSSMRGLGLLLLVAILVIYLVLGVLYESFIHPLTILSALPFAAFGALLTLLVFGVDLSIYAFVGVIMLVGLVKKNGIMMIDFALAAQRKSGKPAEDAIYEACVVRFRPIMMTTMAALMGTLPIALGMGAGSEARRPLGLAVVGGLLFSQFLALYVTPVIYVTFDRIGRRLAPRSAG